MTITSLGSPDTQLQKAAATRKTKDPSVAVYRSFGSYQARFVMS